MLLLESIWTWNHFFFGITYATAASLIFLFVVLIFFKPRIRIAPFAGKIQSNGNSVYIFKFVNKSYYSAHDAKAELHQIRRIPMGNGKYNNEYQKLSLLNGDIFRIPGKLPIWAKDDAYPHCLIVYSSENLDEILANDSYAVILRVGLKHGLTGLSKVFDQEYAKTDIRAGKFKPGPKFASQ
ncbi:MAG TPA: hypothetical protein VFE32_08845 [Puia sp.]|jgi:hypothetical protein|nr:hypothetical protein [Puia sp.]